MEKLYRFLVTCSGGSGPGEGDRRDIAWADHDKAFVLELDGPDETHHSSEIGRRFMTQAFSDPAHYCKTIPCDYCGKDWPHRRIGFIRSRGLV